MTISHKKICFELISNIPSRTRDVVELRFGLKGAEPQTLEAVGSTHGITRERVRQIIEEGLLQARANAKTSRKNGPLKSIFERFKNSLKQSGNIRRKDLLLQDLGVKEEANYVIFLLHLGDEFHYQRETQTFHPFWATKKDIIEQASEFHKNILSYFEKNQEPLPAEVLKTIHKINSLAMLSSFLDSSKNIIQGHDGKWGLAGWPEVDPRGVKDKAYLVLKTSEKPLHFTEVTNLIKELEESRLERKKKNVLSQTVHNELIKDSRFVLVGRGTYGLKDWGLTPGTVRDVISSILEGKKSFSKEEIIRKTLEKRQVKESTIMLNLQDRASFLRDSAGKYYLIS